MLEAGAWGLLGGSSLLVGAVLGISTRKPLPEWVIGLILAFGAGTLISALAFELTEEAFHLGGADAVALGLAAGALAYFLGDRLLEPGGGEMRMSAMGDQADSSSNALLLGAVLDGIPESAVIGISLLEGGGVAIPVLAAVFLSNLPESLSAATGRRRADERDMPGHGRGRIVATWAIVTLVCGVAAAAGYGLLDGAGGNTIALIQAFAGGAVLTMLTDNMIPEALKHGGKTAGLVTVLGFATAFLLSMLG